MIENILFVVLAIWYLPVYIYSWIVFYAWQELVISVWPFAPTLAQPKIFLGMIAVTVLLKIFRSAIHRGTALTLTDIE